MILDQFDQDILALKGQRDISAADKILKHYGRRVGDANAKKYMAALYMHVEAKQRIPEPDGRSGLNEVVTKYDGTKTVKRMVVMSESDANDPIRVLQLNGYDPLKCQLIKWKTKRTDWDVTMKMTSYNRKEGIAKSWKEKETNHLYNVELDIKPIQAVISTDYVKQVFEELDPPKIKAFKYEPGRMMLELAIVDPHFGKPAWAEETGEEYDLEIAEDLFKKTIDEILGKIEIMHLPIEQIEYQIGQDFFHFDNAQGTTTGGTQMETAAHWQKMFRTGVECLVWMVEKLRPIAPVFIKWVGGNHDEVLSYCAAYAIYAWYKDCENVTVDLTAAPRKYIHYGVNLIGLSHGKEGKRIEHLMQQEMPGAWGETIFREWHLGDLHHEDVKEVGGVKIRRLSSFTACDGWHAKKGYRAVRTAQAFVWDREKGRQFVIDSNVMVE